MAVAAVTAAVACDDVNALIRLCRRRRRVVAGDVGALKLRRRARAVSARRALIEGTDNREKGYEGVIKKKTKEGAEGLSFPGRGHSP
jgi:hypothetical protein